MDVFLVVPTICFAYQVGKEVVSKPVQVFVCLHVYMVRNLLRTATEQDENVYLSI